MLGGIVLAGLALLCIVALYPNRMGLGMNE